MQEIHTKIKSLVNTIRFIREKKNYSQAYIAAKLSISQNAYSKMELGNSTLTVERLLMIAELLEMTVPELINYPAPTPIARQGKHTP
ncbi:helix-turn-helix domain-containing protein [Mucilaginibacter celer]|uniref:Helix-turn-helix domain-containing protein n=1 Tax=Mucilaginibacter celer TaxID=2305508 RepID=A0A494W061_9SPHI|nr:helix-turn-helix transcriptional regulator [Mucilaginibacter celer]AYL99140.1 helix-turn-helix domain-containing protein [Mucilaginibacter celer]